MERQQRPGQIVFTNKARCRDCYRCVRVCPVKAIRMEHGQAFVDPDRCISCGTCIRECPQGAKSFRNDVEKAGAIVSQGGMVAASIAPSFAGVLSEWERRRLPSALRKLGFGYVGETAIGAYMVARKTADLVNAEPDKVHVCTACPAAVSYVEQYRPDLAETLTPIVSPMLAHARHIKARFGPDAKVIFIGPCVAKKAEAERPEHAGLVDCALTFTELFEWLEQQGITLQECEESWFDEEPGGNARFYPVEGGSLRTADLTADLLATQTMSVSGFEELKEALDELDSLDDGVLIEPLFCPQGCVGGPGIRREQNLYERRRELLEFAREHPGAPTESAAVDADLCTWYGPRAVDEGEPITEEQIREALARTGKVSPEDELNCGACGYASCRDKAIAVIRGMAEPEMCIPYMRRLAEQRTDRIIDTSPNGIVILDERLTIISMNPAFRRMFMCSDAVLGRKISYLMDPDPFERLVAGETDLIEMVGKHDKYGLICHQIIYPLREERQYVGIFVNITRSQTDRATLDRMRNQTIEQAQQLLEHQMRMAQQIAQFLGESAAQGEKLVENLMRMAHEEAEGVDKEAEDWRPGTSTWK
ncbi:MAG: 4Fe-4S binding protein [Armatimonadetes bacterium]|nr:4Fe-4S binding protein [Armatimonadota bacterium]